MDRENGSEPREELTLIALMVFTIEVYHPGFCSLSLPVTLSVMAGGEAQLLHEQSPDCKVN